jgi:hypothetical protein
MRKSFESTVQVCHRALEARKFDVAANSQQDWASTEKTPSPRRIGPAVSQWQRVFKKGALPL